MVVKRAAAFVAVLAIAVVGVLWARSLNDGSAREPRVSVASATAPVTRTTIQQQIRFGGTLGFGATTPVPSQLPEGVLTSLPAPGHLIDEGTALFAIAGTSVIVLTGTTPAYRDFEPGMSDGHDIRQLEQGLVDIGAWPASRITVDDHFDRNTSAAIRNLEAWLIGTGAAAPGDRGRLALGEIVFLPARVRVDATLVELGARVTPGTPVLTVSSAAPHVTANLTADHAPLVHVGDHVEVTLREGEAPVTGTIS